MAVILKLPGRVDYRDAHHLQRELLTRRIVGEIPDVILLLEHEPVITVGRSRDAAANVLDPNGETPVVEVERGGDVTWHGPGQLVAYPIVKLEGRRQDLHLHLHSLEEAVIRVLRDLRLRPTRDPRNTGVWLPMAGEVLPRKVASIGIACKRWVTWHGLALNVDVDLDVFHAINPCGFAPTIMTRLVDHLAHPPTLEALASPLADHLLATLDLTRSPDADHRAMRRLVADIGATLPPRRASA